VAPRLSYPPRIATNGAFATVEQNSDAADVEAVACIALTRRGERELRPGFGLTDPTFAGIEPAELDAQVALWGPPVEIDDITVTPIAEHVQQVRVEMHRP
jgi:hypothetical protein